MSDEDRIGQIEAELSRSRDQLRESVGALSEKLTLGRVIDELVFGGGGKSGSGASMAVRVAVPGAVLGAGAAILLASGALPLFRARSSSAGASGQRQEAHPRDLARLSQLEAFQRLPKESPESWRKRRLGHDAGVLGLTQADHEDDEGFQARVQQAVESFRAHLGKTAGGARNGLEKAIGGAKAATGDAVSSATETLRDGFEKSMAFYASHPVAGLGICFGLGLLAGAMAPLGETQARAPKEPEMEAPKSMAGGSKGPTQAVGEAAEKPVVSASARSKRSNKRSEAEAHAGDQRRTDQAPTGDDQAVPAGAGDPSI